MRAVVIPYEMLTSLSSDSTWEDCRTVLDTVDWPPTAEVVRAPTPLRTLVQQARQSDRFNRLDVGLAMRLGALVVVPVFCVVITLVSIEFGLPMIKYGQPPLLLMIVVIWAPRIAVPASLPLALWVAKQLPVGQKKAARRVRVVEATSELSKRDFLFGTPSRTLINLPSLHWLLRHIRWVDGVREGLNHIDLDDVAHTELVVAVAELHAALLAARERLTNAYRTAEPTSFTELTIDRRSIEPLVAKADALCAAAEPWRRWLEPPPAIP